MYRTEIIANQFEFGAKPGASSNNYSEQPQNNNSFEEKEISSNEIEYPTDDINPEDIPF
jgi:hypothetical protein